MKKLLLLPILAALLVSSCSSKFGIAKRKYTKGYYFSVSQNKQSNKKELGNSNKINSKKTNLIDESKNPVSSKIVTNSIEIANVKHTNANRETELNMKPATKYQKDSRKSINQKSNLLSSVNTLYHKKEINIKKLDFNSTNRAKGGESSDTKLILLVILSFFIAPLAMYLWDKNTDIWFIIDLIAYLLLFSSLFWAGGYLGLTAIVIALLRIFGVL